MSTSWRRVERMSPNRTACPKLTVLTPVYNESDNIDRYVRGVEAVLFAHTDIDAGVLFIDDGSSDDSWRKIEQLAERSTRYSGLRLSRNFGAHLALAAGIDHVPADADIIAILACDLQDPPTAIVEFVAEWRRGADIVFGSRRARGDSFWRKFASNSVETLLRRYAMPSGSNFRTGSFLLMDRQVLECFRQYRESNRITFALVAWTGFNQAVVEYDRAPRKAGLSGWSFSRLMNASYDVFIGFSPLPAKFLTFLGFLVFGASIISLLYLIAAWIFQSVQPGWTGIMVSITVFFGLVFMMLGMIVEYLYRIFIETKRRPLYFVSRITGSNLAGPSLNG